MRPRLLLLTLFAFSSLLSAQVSFGIQIGAPPPPVYMLQPAAPGPGFLWVDGYWYPVGHHYRWHAGYWTMPPYPGAYWAPARYDGSRYFGGYWMGGRGRIEHDHHWDHGRGRDFNRGHGNGNGHGHGNGHGQGDEHD